MKTAGNSIRTAHASRRRSVLAVQAAGQMEEE